MPTTERTFTITPTTSNGDRAKPAREVFSHPHKEPPPGVAAVKNGRKSSHENLFREPPGIAGGEEDETTAPDPRPTRLPPTPFARTPSDTVD